MVLCLVVCACSRCTGNTNVGSLYSQTQRRVAIYSVLCVEEVAIFPLNLPGDAPLQAIYHLDEVILVRKVFTLFSAISDMHLEICQQVSAVLSEISQLLLAFNTAPVGRAICVIV